MLYWLKDAAVRYGLVLLLMAFDIISGMVKATIADTPFSSAKMASGMFKKMGSLLCMAASDVLYFIAPRYLDVELQIQIWVFLYVAAMETVSIFENVGSEEMKKLAHKIAGLMKNKAGGGEDDGYE